MSDDAVLSEKFKIEYKKNKEILFNRIFEEIAYKVEYYNKYNVNHDYDTHYDSSGRIESTNAEYSIDDYPKASEFLDEYNGIQYPTYTSGMGLMAVRHYDDIEYIINDYIGEIIENMIKDINKRAQAVVYEEIYEVNDRIEQTVFDHFYNTMSEIENMDLADIYDNGIFMAKRRKQIEEETTKRREEIRIIDKKESEEIMARLQEKYLEKYNTKLPKITRENIEDYIEFREFLKDNFTSREIRILVNNQPRLFSNRVAYELANI